MDRLNPPEHQEKRVRNIALKAVGHKKSQDSSEDSDGETFRLLSKKFSKFLKKNNNKNHSWNRYNKKLNDFNINKYTCFVCGEQRHIKANCPNKGSKNSESSRRFEKKWKSKKAYIASHDMMLLLQALHQVKIRRQICVLWLRRIRI